MAIDDPRMERAAQWLFERIMHVERKQPDAEWPPTDWADNWHVLARDLLNAIALDQPEARVSEQLREFDAWLSFHPEFSEVLRAFRDAFGTDTSAEASPAAATGSGRPGVGDTEAPGESVDQGVGSLASTRVDMPNMREADQPARKPAQTGTCPTCGSGDRFIVRGLCASDTHDPDDWHRAAPSTEVEGEAVEGDTLWRCPECDAFWIEDGVGGGVPECGPCGAALHRWGSFSQLQARADTLTTERDEARAELAEITASLQAESDENFGRAEKAEAERDDLASRLERAEEALTRVERLLTGLVRWDHTIVGPRPERVWLTGAVSPAATALALFDALSLARAALSTTQEGDDE